MNRRETPRTLQSMSQHFTKQMWECLALLQQASEGKGEGQGVGKV